MRNLTIQRAKRFVACLAIMKVYIEDPSANDLVINRLPCRKLGELKNGETKTFSIGEETAKVFVIADKVSKSYCNEYFRLPAGTEDVTLSGRNRFSIVTGNAFRFDNVTDPEVLENRKKSAKKGRLVLAVMAIVGFIVGFLLGLLANSQPVEPQTFTADGMQITLTNEFQKEESTDFVAHYSTVDMAVLIRKDSFAKEPALRNYSLQEYAEQLYHVNGHDAPDGVQEEENLTYYEYKYMDSEAQMTYVYFTYVYQTDEGFWIVQFATPQVEVENYRSSITEWAKSVTFDADAD